MKKFRVTTQHFDKSIVGKIIIPVTENPDRDQLLDSLSHLNGFDILRKVNSGGYYTTWGRFISLDWAEIRI
jgi:hypothetical protein